MYPIKSSVFSLAECSRKVVYFSNSVSSINTSEKNPTKIRDSDKGF